MTMHRLATSLTRDEVGRLLDIPPAVVNGLVESGRLLCQFRDGEARVPLEELEAFLRDSLVRLYRAEAAADVADMVLAEEPRAKQAVAAAEVAEPEPEVEEAPPTVPLVAVPAALDEEDEKEDLRAAPRYAPRHQIDGIFGETRFTIVQLSNTGLRIRHTGSLVPGEEAKLSFALLSSARSIVIRARVVWTSLARSGGAMFSISGLRVTEHGERLSRAIEVLNQSHDLQPERRDSERRAGSRPTVALEGIPDEEVAMVLGALRRFAVDPVEAHRWYSRGRFALADDEVRRQAPSRPRDREEVLGIWEYLERQVDIPRIHGVLAWSRKARVG